MNTPARIVSALAMFLVIYFGGLNVVPSLAMSLGLYKACPWLFGTSLATQLAFLVLSLIAAAVIGKGDWRRYGLAGTKASFVVRAVVISAVAMLILMSPMILMTLAGPATAEAAPTTQPAPRPSFGHEGLFHTIIFVWLIASTCEEVFYRGFLQGYLSPLATHALRLRSVRISLPVAICALLFGLGHLCLLGMVPTPMLVMILISTTTAGLVAGYYRERSSSLIPAIAAHMTFNIVGTMVPFILGSGA